MIKIENLDVSEILEIKILEKAIPMIQNYNIEGFLRTISHFSSRSKYTPTYNKLEELMERGKTTRPQTQKISPLKL